jgi:hypothetical protein
MQDQINQLKTQVEELQKKLDDIERMQNTTLKGFMDDVLIERVFNADTSGTPATNSLLRTVGGNTILNYPTRIMIYTWKGQRLAIPVYEASTIIIP